MKTWRLAIIVISFLTLFLGVFLVLPSAAQRDVTVVSDEDATPTPVIDWANVTMDQYNSVEPSFFSPQMIDVPIDPPVAAITPPFSSFLGKTNTTHIVKLGESLYQISLLYGVSINSIINANNIVNPRLIYPGQILTITSDGVADSSLQGPENSDPRGNTYVVKLGDTLGAIARRFVVSLEQLAAVNQISNRNFIRVGQILNLPISGEAPEPSTSPSKPESPPSGPPTNSGNVYYVRFGDSLYLIAQRFGVDVKSLATINNITNPSLIYVGQKLIIPDKVVIPPANSSDPSPSNFGFIWPSENRDIVKFFQYGHGAIDIVMLKGTPVTAIAAGNVEFAGWNNYGYGWMVVLDHGNGIRTLYAHANSLDVDTGQKVDQGQIILKSGSSGNSTMPHLHLELMINLQAVNPCLYLPGGC